MSNEPLSDSGPYYDADGIQIWHGDCRQVDAWDIAGGVMVTDPPYGRGWKQGRLAHRRHANDAHEGIANDNDTSVRDAILERWAPRPAIVFGDLMLQPPPGTKHVLVYRKAPNAGLRGAIAGVRRDAEAIYLIGKTWPSGLGGRSAVIATSEPSQGGPYSPAGQWHHPHAKPMDVMTALIDLCPPLAVIVDPFMGSGSTLVAAARRRRAAIGVEIEERYCEIAARRVAQGVLDLEWTGTDA